MAGLPPYIKEAIINRIRELCKIQKSYLCEGGAVDYAEYKYSVGYLRGADEATVEVLSVLDHFVENELDDLS